MEKKIGESGEDTPFDLQIDAATGIIRIIVQGFWPDDVPRRFLKELEGFTRKARVRTRDLMVLVDATRTSVHSQEAVADFAKADASLSRPNDRIAVVTMSALTKLQFRRFFNSATMEYIGDALAAEEWLLELRNS